MTIEPGQQLGDDSRTAPVAEALPFLRITGTFPAAGGRVSTIQLDLNVGDVDDDPAEDDNVPGGPIPSSLTELVTSVISAMRRAPSPQTIVLTGPAARLFTDRTVHADDCNGECGLPTDDTAAAAAEQPGDGQKGGE